VENEQGEDEHEAVVAGQRLASHGQPVKTGDPAIGPVPGGHFFGPAILALGLDLQARNDQSHYEPKQGRDKKLKSEHLFLLFSDSRVSGFAVLLCLSSLIIF